MTLSEKLPSRLELIFEFVNKLIAKIKSLPIEENTIFNIKLSLEEALVNAVKHGNKLNPDLSVEVTLETTDNSLIIKVKDEGKGFDFHNIPDPTQGSNLEKLHGRGIFLIKNLMDEVEFFDCGREIKMIKFFKPGGTDEDKRRKE
jgi:serine/threonine-protein kinase RsbW